MAGYEFRQAQWPVLHPRANVIAASEVFGQSYGGEIARGARRTARNPGAQMHGFGRAMARLCQVTIVSLASAVAALSASAQDAKPIAIGKAMVDGSIRIEVEELKRAGNGTMTLKFAVVNESSHDLGGDFLGASTLIDVHLVDLVNRRQYSVGMKDIANTLTSGFAGAKTKSRTEGWAIYAAPPPAVTKLTILLPNFYPIDDVPIGN